MLNPEIDLMVNLPELTEEFKMIGITLFRYGCQKADAERTHDIAEARVKEIKAAVLISLKQDTSVKHTESSLAAAVEINPAVQEAIRAKIDAKRDLGTIASAVDSMKAKKDAIIQLGSDRRKEVA